MCGRVNWATMWKVGVSWQDCFPVLYSSSYIHSSPHQPYLPCNNSCIQPFPHPLLTPPSQFSFLQPSSPISLFDSHPISSFLSHLLPVLPLLARVARQCSNAICQRSMPTASCPHTHTHIRPQTRTNTRTVWQGHLPAQDIPISTLPPPDHHRPTHCVTCAHTLAQALMSHTLHLSPNRGSRGASAGAETGVGDEWLLLQ